MLSAVNGMTSLRHSQHEEGEEKEMGTSMAGSAMIDHFGPRRAAEKRQASRQASRQADGRRGEIEDESSYHRRTYPPLLLTSINVFDDTCLIHREKSVTVRSRKTGACVGSIRRLCFRFGKVPGSRQASEHCCLILHRLLHLFRAGPVRCSVCCRCIIWWSIWMCQQGVSSHRGPDTR